MTRRSVACALAGLSLLLAGCVSSGGQEAAAAKPETKRAEAASSVLGESAFSVLPSSGLGPQQLLPGECGMFLWSKTDATKFIFFTKALTGKALFREGDETRVLTQTGAGGTIFGQFNTSMTYKNAEGAALALSYHAGEALENGQRIEGGLITTTDAEGWQTKMPVVGVRACQPE